MLREDTPGDKRLIAYVTTEEGSGLAAADLRGYCKEHLPDYMIPSGFMILDEMPLTPSGKLNRRQLPASEITPQGEGELPATPTEQNLARIWETLLKVDGIRVDDDFFDLGGHSLLTIQLTRKIKAATGRELSIADVFENPTVRQLSLLLEDASWEMEQVERRTAKCTIRRAAADSRACSGAPQAKIAECDLWHLARFTSGSPQIV